MLIEMAKIVPNGILLFFTSYKMLHDVYDSWRSGILFEIKKYKKVFYEGKNSQQNEKVMTEFTSSV